MKSILFLSLFFSVQLSHAGLFECVCNFFTGKDRAEKTVECVQNSTVAVIKGLKLEESYALTLNNGTKVEGILQAADLDHIKMYNGSKSVIIKSSRISSYKKIELNFTSIASKADLLRYSAVQKYIQESEIRKTFFLQNKTKLREEFSMLNDMSPGEKEDFVKKYAQELEERIKQKFNIKNIGYHFNNNGGLGQLYAKSGGINATMGDYGTQLGLANDTSLRVYFFRSEHLSLYEIINQTKMKRIIDSGRMGDELILINLDHPYFQRAHTEKGILDSNDISYEFNQTWLNKQNINADQVNQPVGIPFETFLFSPVPVYQSKLRHWLDLRRMDRITENYLALKSIASMI